MLALYPGSFNPLTLGHLDIIERASRVFPRLMVAVASTGAKQPLWDVHQRLAWIAASIQDLQNVEVKIFDNLLVDFAKEHNASVIIRGLRGISDLAYELQMASANRALFPALETIFLTPSAKTSHISASLVREVAHFGGDLTPFVPAIVAEALKFYFKR